MGVEFIPVRAASGGPPFPSNAADNGLSVDPISGRIVLGGDIATPSLLLSERYIETAGNLLHFVNVAGGNDWDASISHGAFVVTENNTSNGAFINADSLSAIVGARSDTSLPGSSPATLRLDNATAATVNLTLDSSDDFVVEQSSIRALLINNVSGYYGFGDVDGSGSGINLYMDGSIPLFRVQLPWGAGLTDLIAGDGGATTLRLGDTTFQNNGLTLELNDNTNVVGFSNTANNVVLSINGQPGFTGTVTPVTSITVEGGIVVAVS